VPNPLLPDSKKAPPERLERPTPSLGRKCSIQLNYGGLPSNIAQSRHILEAAPEAPNFRKKGQTSAKVPHFSSSFLSVAEVAIRLNKAASTITRWCETGKLPAIPKPYGAKLSYLIASTTIEMLLLHQKEADKVKKEKKSKALAKRPHPEYLPHWVQAMKQGILTGKAYSSQTVELYEYYARAFLSRHKELSVKTLETELLQIPVQHFGKREKIYKALLCFSKWLIRQKAIDASFLQEIKPLLPKRHLPPKRHVINAEEVEQLLSACQSLTDKALVTVLAGTGIRAAEFCALHPEDIDLKAGTMLIRLAKGGKTRKLGLTLAVVKALEAYLKEYPTIASQPLFQNSKGKALEPNGLLMRLRRISRLAGLKVSPHALRRAFVTINANRGRSIIHLQHACGHSDITTTRSYCRETEEEVIAAMKDW
jgi:integrase